MCILQLVAPLSMHGNRSTRVRDRSISSKLQLRLPLCLARSLLIRIRTRRDLPTPSGRVQGGIQHRRWHGMLIAIRKLLRKHLFQLFLYVYPEAVLAKIFSGFSTEWRKTDDVSAPGAVLWRSGDTLSRQAAARFAAGSARAARTARGSGAGAEG
jgi:hypothetical protein